MLSVHDLKLTVRAHAERRLILDRIGFHIDDGRVLGLVGESGSGKSMTAKAMVALAPPHSEVSGSICFDGSEVLEMSPAALRAFRATQVGMVFQDPSAQINPVRTVGDFLTEGWRTHRGWSKRRCEADAVRLLESVWVDRPRHRLRQYPFELSGGLLQRVMIASALSMEPRLLIADEPTTALDVTTQAEIVAILAEKTAERSLSMLFITHDLDLADAVCDRIAVMYAGRIVEEQGSDALAATPRHPYSCGLAKARPRLTGPRETLAAIPGVPAAAFEVGPGCAFAPRCGFPVEICREERPELRHLGAGRVACHRAEELEPILADGRRRG